MDAEGNAARPVDEGAGGAGGPAPAGRRGFLGLSGAVAVGAVALGYGACGAMSARYLYPARSRRERWLFVVELARLPPGNSVDWRAPTGERVTVARTGAGTAAETDFVALSSTCPHLGCQVHWEGHNERFFCPCHNGVFTPDGEGIGGPPGEAGQSLPRYALQVRDGLLFILAPTEGLTVARRGGLTSPGHDACLDAGAEPA